MDIVQKIKALLEQTKWGRKNGTQNNAKGLKEDHPETVKQN